MEQQQEQDEQTARERARSVGLDPAGIRADAEARQNGGDGVPSRSELASIDDMTVTRKGGEVEPLRARSVLEGHGIEFRPLTYRDRNKYGLQNRGLAQLDNEERAEFLREHMVTPSFEDVRSEEDLERFSYTVIMDLLLTIERYSRDHRRNKLPRPVDDDSPGGAQGKADGE